MMIPSRIWHQFLVYLPVILILSMIIMIYITYLITYIAVLINVDNSTAENFILRHTSSRKNAKVKGWIFLGFTLYFLVFLLISIFKTVFTNPGYFPEPTELEYKLISSSINNLLGLKSDKKKEKDSEKSDIKLSVKENSKSKSSKSKDYLNLDLEYDSVNDESIRKKKNDKTFNTLNLDDSEDQIKEVINNKINPKNPFELSKDLKNKNIDEDLQHKLVTNFTNSNMEGPINYHEFVDFHKNIDSYYESRKVIVEKSLPIITKKTNDEIIESNKIDLMEKRKEKNDSHSHNTEIEIYDLYKGIDIAKLNQCGTCQRIKIERSHHCKMCQKCVLKMDHHCPWLANCIGFYNYKFFCLIHFFGVISTSLIFFSFWETVVNMQFNYNTNVFECWYVTFVFITNFALMSFLSWLLWVNIKLVFNGETIIEQSDRERFPSSKSFNIYDMGWKRNFVNVFGNKWYLWFIPAFSNSKGKGLFYETKKNFYIDN